MKEFFSNLNPILLAGLAGIFTWGMTAAGSAMVFFFKEINKKVLNSMLGFASGVMIAASFWSLLNPAIKIAEEIGLNPWLVASSGFMSGGFFLWGIDKILPHLHQGLKAQPEGIKTSWQRSILLVLAVTLHNIPEGLAIGVAFGVLGSGIEIASFSGALALALGIGLQNFPEGAAISVPLRREGMRRMKAFNYGQLSGVVEPISAIIGAYFVVGMNNLLPFALSFAAGAMIYVVVEELIPEAQSSRNEDSSTLGTMAGFAIMMILDVALG
ncbi:MAG: ZIP family metal transporter [Fusobacteriaceae bacterium]